MGFNMNTIHVRLGREKEKEVTPPHAGFITLLRRVLYWSTKEGGNTTRSECDTKKAIHSPFARLAGIGSPVVAERHQPSKRPKRSHRKKN